MASSPSIGGIEVSVPQQVKHLMGTCILLGDPINFSANLRNLQVKIPKAEQSPKTSPHSYTFHLVLFLNGQTFLSVFKKVKAPGSVFMN
jgi:hypothetical protein